MILYDEKYNFLGMGTDSLGFLGYEDITDFMSLNSDFADLFVQKEGYIYKFDNFSWIDFVLFSGSANKSAIVRVKNSQEIKIGLSIREIFLANSIGESKKLYSVKIINDEFQDISIAPKESSSASNKGSSTFSLSGLVNQESSLESKEHIDQEKIETKKSFVLDLENSNDTKESEIDTQDSSSGGLDFLKLDKKVENSSIETIEDKIVDDTLETKESSREVKIDLFKTDIDTKDSEIDTQDSSGGGLDFLKLDKKVENSSIETIENKMVDDTLETKESSSSDWVKLDFLKSKDQDNSSSEPKDINLENSTKQDKNITEKEKIIQKIKSDIEEIDEIDTKPKSDDKYKKFILNIPDRDETKEEEQTSSTVNSIEVDNNNIKSDIEQKNSNKPEKVKSKNLISTIGIDSGASFTDTLKNLFEKKIVKKDDQDDFIEIQEQSDSSSNSISNKIDIKPKEDIKEDPKVEIELESNEKEYKIDLQPKIENISTENISTENISIKKDEEIEPISTAVNNSKSTPFSSLSSLGLSAKEEFDLISDFVDDTKESIFAIEHFINTEDFDKINYSLVKIKSSAEILNLEDIIEISGSIRRDCITKDRDKISLNIERLKEQLTILQKHLEEAVV